MNSKTTLLLIAAVILSAIGYFWFINNFEEVEKIKWRGIQGKAQTDKFHVAERFLREKGLDVTRTKTLSPVKKNIAPYHTIFMGKTQYALTPTETQALLEWTKQGNTLIVQGQESNDSFVADKLSQSKNLLDQAGITVSDREDDEYKCEKSSDIEYVEKAPADKQPSNKDKFDNETIDDKLDNLLSIKKDENTATFIANGQPIILDETYLDFHYKATGTTKKIASQKTDCGYEIYAVFQYGKGKIVTYSQDQEFFHTNNWRNFIYMRFLDTIFSDNNATYLYWLLHQGGEPKRILWYESQKFPSALTIIWKYWRWTVIMALILILAWVWRYAPRFGSLLLESETKSLSITRHLQATGQFYYDSEDKDILLGSCYEQAESHIAKSIPMANQLSKDKLIEKIASLTSLPVGKIAQVIYRQPPSNEAEFIEITQIINQMRQKL